MSEIVDRFGGVDEGDTAEGLEEKMELDDLERRAQEAIKLAPEAYRQRDAEAIEGIAFTLLAYRRKELER